MPILLVIIVVAVVAVVVFAVTKKKSPAPAKESAPVQPTVTQAPAGKPTASVNAADELKKYKGLLDDGIISQEEYDAKKKELLDL